MLLYLSICLYFQKEKPNAIFNPYQRQVKQKRWTISGGTIRNADGTTKPMSKNDYWHDYGQRFNIWEQSPVSTRRTSCTISEKLAQDHIASWSNRDQGDRIWSFLGSGTTCVAAKALKRRYIGSEMNDSISKWQKNGSKIRPTKATYLNRSRTCYTELLTCRSTVDTRYWPLKMVVVGVESSENPTTSRTKRGFVWLDWSTDGKQRLMGPTRHNENRYDSSQ